MKNFFADLLRGANNQSRENDCFGHKIYPAAWRWDNEISGQKTYGRIRRLGA